MSKAVVVFLVLWVVLICGCIGSEQKTPTPQEKTTSTLVEETTTSTSITTSTEIDCMPPKKVVGSECCLDEDNNNVCDSKETPEETCSDGMKNQDETDVDCGGVCPPCKIEASEPPTYKPASYWIYETTMEGPGKEDSEYIYMYEYIGEEETSDGRFHGFDIVPIRFGEDNEIIKLTSRTSDYLTITSSRIYLNISKHVLSSGKGQEYPYIPPLIVFDFPLEVGKQWGGEHKKKLIHGSKGLGSLSVNYSARVLREEEVSVPAGTFNTFVIERFSTVGVGSDIFKTINETVWYSPEVEKHVKLVEINDLLVSGKTEIVIAPTRGARVTFSEYNWTEELFSYNLQS